MERTMRTARWATLALALGLVASLGLTACGSGGGGSDGVATLGGDGASENDDDGGGGDDGELSEDEIQDAQLAFAECMREHGIDMPDPQFGEDGETVIQVGPGPGGGAAPSEEEMEAAQEACREHLEKIRESMPEPDPEEVERMKQQALEFAECMREQGVEDFPDPEFMDEGGIGQKIDEGVAEDPDFEAAQEHCAEEVGMEGPGGGPRLGGGGDSDPSDGSD